MRKKKKGKWNMNTIAAEICEREGKKKQVSIGQVKEILGVFADMVKDDLEVLTTFMNYAGKRK